MRKVTVPSFPNTKQFNYSEEIISIQAYNSSDALKNEIRNKIINRSKSNWDFVKFFSQGSNIYLIFKQRN